MEKDTDENAASDGGFVFDTDAGIDSTDGLPTFVGRVSDRLRSRRTFMRDAATVGGGALALSAISGTAAAEGHDGEDGGDSSGGDGSSEEVSDIDVLNYALSLEHLEAAFYDEFLENHTESDVERSDVAAYFARPTLRYSTYQQIQDVRDHEEAHVEVLTQTIEDLGGTPVEATEYEFPYETIEEFVALADRLESVGVSAYAGAAPLLSNPDLIPPALSIHSVEANHATYFQLLHLQRPAPNAFNPARSMDQVLPIAKKFIVGAGGGEQTFTVTVEAVSTPGTVDTERAMGVVPLSPGAWAVYTGANPAFTVGESANAGTELIAEDGFPGGSLPPESGGLADTLAAAENVTDSGTFVASGGDLAPALAPGASAEFTASASPGDLLTMETMFVQSDDWFYGFDGLSLFDGDRPISGTVTNELGLYDAGTEVDAPPGHGPTSPPGAVQKPVQDPMATDVGTDEHEPVQLASERHPDYDIPATDEVIEVTITPQ